LVVVASSEQFFDRSAANVFAFDVVEILNRTVDPE
jgi:hypothetical protein